MTLVEGDRGRLARVVAAAELPIFLAIAPALMFPTPRRLVVLLAVPAVWYAVRLVTGRLVPATPLNWALALLLVMVGVSLRTTFDVGLSLGKVSGVLLGVLLFWAVARWLTTVARLRLAVALFVCAGVGLAIAGLFGTEWIAKFPRLAEITYRLPAAFRGIPGAEKGFNPNPVAGALVLFVPLQLMMLRPLVNRWLLPRPAWGWRVLMGAQIALFLLSATVIVLTQSHGAWVGLGVAGMAFLLWHDRGSRIVGVSLMAIAVVLAIRLGSERLLDVAFSRAGAEVGATVSGRFEIWSAALQGIRDYPLGMGMNTFRVLGPTHYSNLLAHHGADIVHAHNNLLQTALDLGLPGLVAYVSIWLIAGGLLVDVYRQSREPVYRVLAGSLGAGLIAYFVFGITDAIPLGAKVGVLFWLALGLVVGLHAIARGVKAPAEGAAPSPRRT